MIKNLELKTNPEIKALKISNRVLIVGNEIDI